MHTRLLAGTLAQKEICKLLCMIGRKSGNQLDVYVDF